MLSLHDLLAKNGLLDQHRRSAILVLGVAACGSLILTIAIALGGEAQLPIPIAPPMLAPQVIVQTAPLTPEERKAIYLDELGKRTQSWAVATRSIGQAEREASNAIDGQLVAIDLLFAEAKEGIRPFVESVFDLNGKLALSGQLLEQGVSQVNGFVNDLMESMTGIPLNNYKGPERDQFADHVREQFKTKVLDPDRLRKTGHAAFGSYAAALEAIEGKLLVDLRADLPNADPGAGNLLPKLTFDAPELASLDGEMGRILDLAGADFAYEVLKFIASEYLGGITTGQILRGTATDTASLEGFAINVAVSMLTGKLIDEAFKATADTPQDQLAARVDAALSRMRDLLVDGDPAAVPNYQFLLRNAVYHSDAKVRSACLEAAELMERSCVLGLRPSLHSLHAKRAVARYGALFHHITGIDDYPTPDYPGAEAVPPSAEAIDFAQKCITRYGAERQ